MEQVFELGKSGSLLVRENGLRAEFICELPDDGRGLYKAYLRGAGGRWLLGTLMPEGGRLRLRRTVSVDELARKGLWPVKGGEAELTFPFRAVPSQAAPRGPTGWSREYEPARLMGDTLLAECAHRLKKAYFRRGEGGFALACPWDSGMVFPMPVLFCFAHVEALGGEPYLIFYFNGAGRPVFPNKGSAAGYTDHENQ